MANERQSPDELLVQTNLSGALSAIQDDPDNPDANWLTYITNNVDTVCRVSFPTPTGNPTVGVDLQEFKIWVRKQPGTGTPTVRIELYENGVSKATILANTSVTNANGQLFSGTWNANLLGTADGSLVECYVYGTAIGGAPTKRCTVEVGAVEWNVTYDVASDFTYIGSGSFDYSGTALQTFTRDFLCVASGELIYSGSALQVYTIHLSYVGSGQFTFSGSAITSIDLIYIGNGELNYSGNALQLYTTNYPYVAGGQFIYSGNAIQSHLTNFLYTGGGQFILSGNALQLYTVNLHYIGNGQYVFSGSAICEYTIGDFTYIGNGQFIYSGNANYSYQSGGKRISITILIGGYKC